MLCLTAREGDYLMIGDDIKVTFMKGTSTDSMRIGIIAPKTLAIKRDRVYEKELRESASDTDKMPDEKLKALDALRESKKDRAQSLAEQRRRASKHSYNERRRAERAMAANQGEPPTETDGAEDVSSTT